MPTGRCAFGNKASRPGGRTRAGAFALLILSALALLLPAAPARPEETIVVRVFLNGEDKGDLFVERTGDGDFLVREEDLAAIGFRDPAGVVREIDGVRHLSLRSLGGTSFEFRERDLSLVITADPSLLPRQEVDLLPARRKNVYYPRDPGGFLNYQVAWNLGDSLSFRSFDVANQAGIRAGEILLLSDSSFTRTPDESRFVRLMTSATWDRRETLQRAVAGDLSASSGELGATVNVGGVSFSKVFRIDPYFQRYPVANVSGVLPLASEVEVYLDGTRIRTLTLPPGEFDLRNITRYSGASVVSLVIRDPFGTERRVEIPFYFTDTLLREGLHEYSYNLGALREDFGSESNRYGRAAFSAFHRYGVSDAVTVGGRAEGSRGVVNLGPEAVFRVRGAGVLAASLSGSHGDGRGFGGGGLLRYTYQGPRWNLQAFGKGFSRDYAVIDEDSPAVRPRLEVGAGAGYGTREAGSLSFNAAFADRHDGPDRFSAAVTYSRFVTRSATLRLSWRKTREAASEEEVFLGLTWYPWRETSLSASYEGGDGRNTETLQVQRNAPAGEGYGFRGSVVRTDSREASSTAADPFFQYNGRYGIYTAAYRTEVPDDGPARESARLTAAGGIAYVGGTAGFSRPVTDSFGLVRVGGLEGVRVSLNHQETGRTGRSGELFLPNLSSYYENQVSIDDRDIPIDYSLSEVVRYVSPPLRSGSVIPFEVKRFQAVTGTIAIRRDGKEVPAEYLEVRMRADGEEVVFPTGRGGEFYLENVPPGRYRVAVPGPDGPCGFEMEIPVSDEMLIDQGGLSCEANP